MLPMDESRENCEFLVDSYLQHAGYEAFPPRQNGMKESLGQRKIRDNSALLLQYPQLEARHFKELSDEDLLRYFFGFPLEEFDSRKLVDRVLKVIRATHEDYYLRPKEYKNGEFVHGFFCNSSELAVSSKKKKEGARPSLATLMNKLCRGSISVIEGNKVIFIRVNVEEGKDYKKMSYFLKKQLQELEADASNRRSKNKRKAEDAALDYSYPDDDSWPFESNDRNPHFFDLAYPCPVSMQKSELMRLTNVDYNSFPEPTRNFVSEDAEMDVAITFPSVIHGICYAKAIMCYLLLDHADYDYGIEKLPNLLRDIRNGNSNFLWERGPTWPADFTESYDNCKLGVAEWLCREKFKNSAELLNELRMTGTKRLVFSDRNTFWGFDKAKPQKKNLNHLGRILQNIRGELVQDIITECGNEIPSQGNVVNYYCNNNNKV